MASTQSDTVTPSSVDSSHQIVDRMESLKNVIGELIRIENERLVGTVRNHQYYDSIFQKLDELRCGSLLQLEGPDEGGNEDAGGQEAERPIIKPYLSLILEVLQNALIWDDEPKEELNRPSYLALIYEESTTSRDILNDIFNALPNLSKPRNENDLAIKSHFDNIEKLLRSIHQAVEDSNGSVPKNSGLSEAERPEISTRDAHGGEDDTIIMNDATNDNADTKPHENGGQEGMNSPTKPQQLWKFVPNNNTAPKIFPTKVQSVRDTGVWVMPLLLSILTSLVIVLVTIAVQIGNLSSEYMTIDHILNGDLD